jgi:hypothetical protein
MAQIVEQAGVRTPADVVLGPIKERIEQAKRDRARFEPVWHSNRAYGAGKQWLKWSRADRRLRLDPADVAGGRERYVADILTTRLWTALGQLGGVDARPQLRFRREDIPSEDFTKAANDALAYGWDSEWLAKEQLSSIKRKLIIDGTAAIQCYFDPTVGQELGEVPVGPDGQPLLEPEAAYEHVSLMAQLGQQAQFKRMKEGRIVWRPRSAFQLLVPPGIEDEDYFPWEAVIEAVQIDKLIERFGDRARGLKEEPLAVLEQIGLKDSIEHGFGADPEGDPGVPGKLDGHVALVTYYERPNREHPKGRVVTYAGERLMEPPTPELPYKRPNGDYSSGLVYFHYWRVEGRFWGRGLIEPGKGIQRLYNRRKQQEHMTIDRGQPYLLQDENSQADKKQTDIPLEIIKYKSGAGPPPQAVPGVPVHESIWRSQEGLKADLEDALGLHAVSTGEEATRQTTYAELALRAEKDRMKIDPIVEDFQAGVNRLVEFSLWDIRQYWPASKVIALAGEEDQAEAVEFKGSDLPEFFLVEIAEGQKPRTEAAEVQLVMDLWNADQAQMPEERRLDLDWLAASLKAGKALDFPESPTDTHQEKARWENTRLLEGDEVEPAYYDPPDVHVPVHREAQVEAEMAGDMDAYQRIENHIAWTEKKAAENAERQAAIQAEGEANLQAAVSEQEQQGAEAEHARALEQEQLRQQGKAQQ